MQWNNGADKHTDLFGPGKHGFKEGNPGTGELASVLGAPIMNDLVANICHVVEAAAVALVPGRRQDLYDAIAAMIAAASFKLPAYAAPAPVFNVSAADHTKLCVAFTTPAAYACTLPPVANAAGRIFVFRREGNNAFTISAQGGPLIDGAWSIALGNMEAVWLQCDGLTWRVVARNTPEAPRLTSADLSTRWVGAGTVNFVKQAPWRFLIVEVAGGCGGGGGGRLSNGGSGGGGGAGGYAMQFIDISGFGVGATIATATIGGGGAPGANGAGTNAGNGGTSSFGGYCSATGGAGGLGDPSGGIALPWMPGGAGYGDIARNGGSGGPAAGTYNGAPGAGAVGMYGIKGGDGGNIYREPTWGSSGFVYIHPFW